MNLVFIFFRTEKEIGDGVIFVRMKEDFSVHQLQQ